MVTLTRRSFLKSLATLAAGLAVPVEVTQTLEWLTEQPEIPITKEAPAGYMVLNGKMLPIANVTCKKPVGFVHRSYWPDPKKPGGYICTGEWRDPPGGWTIIVYALGFKEACFVRDMAGEPVTFSISPYNSNIRVNGEGYISSISTESTPMDLESEYTEYSFEIETTRELEFNYE